MVDTLLCSSAINIRPPTWETIIVSRNELSEFMIISSDCLANGSYFNPSFRYFLRCSILLFLILISSVLKLSFVDFESILTPARISGLVCMIHARRFRMVLKLSNDTLLGDGIDFCGVVMLFQEESSCLFGCINTCIE